MNKFEELAGELVSLDAQASPGPWEVACKDDDLFEVFDANGKDVGGYIYELVSDPQNLALLVMLRNNLPTLLEALKLAAEMDTLKRRLELAEAVCRSCEWDYDSDWRNAHQGFSDEALEAWKKEVGK